MDKLDADVAIIGGGLSGLVAAKLLNDAGIDFQLLEASSRFGGRVFGFGYPDNDESADFGPTWVWPDYQPDAARWFDILEIKTFDQFNEGNAVIDLDAALPPQFQPLPAQHGIKRPIGGPQAIIDKLVQQLPMNRIHTSSLVEQILFEGGEFELSGHRHPLLFAGSAKKIIIALPLRLFAETIHTNIFDDGFMSAMKAAPTWMATQAKLVAFYEKPFWREQGLSGRVASRVGPMVEMHDNSSHEGKQGAIFGFIGVPPDIRDDNSVALHNAAEAQLVRCFGEQAKDYMHLQIQDWARNGFICSKADLKNEPQHPSLLPDKFRKPHMDSKVHFAVAETADNEPGLIAGAFQAGERAAKAIIGL